MAPTKQIIVLIWCVECGREAKVAPVYRFGDGTYGGPCRQCWKKFNYQEGLWPKQHGIPASFDERQANIQ